MSEFVTHPKVDAFLSGLQKVRRNGRGFMACCPAHDDKDPSLSIGINESGMGLYCFAGCPNEKILEARGMSWADLFFDDKPSKAKPRQRSARAMELESLSCVSRLQAEPDVLNRIRFGRVIDHETGVRDGRGWSAKALEMLEVGWDGSRLTLPVRTEEGKLHDVLRYDPWGKRRKVLAGQGKSRLPWPSPERVDADVLFLVEGEGTAISMWTVGLKAIGLPGSIGKPKTSVTYPGAWQGAGWHKAWARRFEKFRTIVCFPDCDVQGRALMLAASYDLTRVGVNTHAVDIGPKSQDGRDIADHLLKTAWDGASRKIARNVIRMMVADKAEVLVA